MVWKRDCFYSALLEFGYDRRWRLRCVLMPALTNKTSARAGVMLVPAPAPGPGGAMRFLRLLAPAPAPLFAPAVAPQVHLPNAIWQSPLLHCHWKALSFRHRAQQHHLQRC